MWLRVAVAQALQVAKAEVPLLLFQAAVAVPGESGAVLLPWFRAEGEVKKSALAGRRLVMAEAPLP